MSETTDGSIAFISDCILRGFENVESIYGYLPLIGVNNECLEKFIFENNKMSICDLLGEIYSAMQNRMKGNLKMIHAGEIADVSSVDFHEKFGWILESKIGKAYLGKITLPPYMKMDIGMMSYFSGNSTIRGDHRLKVGAFCSIASGLYITTTNYSHPTAYPSTYNFMGNDRIVSENMHFDISFAPTKEIVNGVSIGSDVWIGRDVTIMNGVTLGHGCVIGIKSLVTKDCEPYGIYGGIPAKLIRYRFNENIISQLLDTKWWEWPYERIKKNAVFFDTDLTDYSGNLQDLIV